MGYDFSSPNITSSSTTVFVSLTNNVNSDNNDCKTNIASKNIDKGKSILEAPPKLEKKETRNPRTKKGNNQKSKQNKQHLSSLWSFRAYSSESLQVVSYSTEQ